MEKPQFDRVIETFIEMVVPEVGWHGYHMFLRQSVAPVASISKILKTKVDENNNDLYKVTAALGHNHFSEDEIHGIRYPSVTTRLLFV